MLASPGSIVARLQAVVRAEQQRAEQERAQADADGGVAAEQGDRDPEEADRRDRDVGDAEAVEVAEHVEPAREAGERAGDRHRADQVLAHADPAVVRRVGVEADRAHLVAERRPVQEQPEDDERRDRDEEADVQALELLVAPEHRQLRRVGDVLRDRQRRVLLFWSGPPSPTRYVPTQIAIQLSMIVVITSWAPTVAFRKPAIPAQIAPASVAATIPISTCGQRRHARERRADPDRDVQADEVLALAADVEHPAAERERDREARSGSSVVVWSSVCERL